MGNARRPLLPAARRTPSLLLLCLAVAGAGAAGVLHIEPTEPQERFAGDNFAMTCSGADNAHLNWTAPNGSVIKNVQRLEGSKLVLVFSNVKKSDKGTYTCLGPDGARTSFDLRVMEKVRFEDSPGEHTVKQTEDATLRCAARGDPPPFISWQRNDAPLKVASDPKDTHYKNNRFQMVNEHELRIRNVTRDDAGNYTCKAVQVFSTDTWIEKLDIKLTVEHMPEWHADYAATSSVFGYRGGLANLTCVAEAQPAGNITWLRGQKRVPLGQHATVFGDGSNSTLQLNLTSTDAFGDYTCVATNPLGKRERVLSLMWGERAPRPERPAPQGGPSERAALLVMKDPPPASPPASTAPGASSPAPAAAGPRPLDLTGLRLLLQPSKRPDEPERVVDFEYHKDGEYELGDLQPGTYYKVRAQWRNAAGLSEPSDVVEIHTLEVGKRNVGCPAARPPALALAALAAAALVASS